MRLSKLKAVSIENPIRILLYKIELLQSSLLSWKKKKKRQLMTAILQESFFRKVEGKNLTVLSTSNPKQSLLVDFRVEKLEFSSVNPQIFLQSRALLTVMVGSG